LTPSCGRELWAALPRSSASTQRTPLWPIPHIEIGRLTDDDPLDPVQDALLDQPLGATRVDLLPGGQRKHEVASRALGAARALRHHGGHRRDAALHVGAPAAVQPAPVDHTRVRLARPEVAHRHSVEMAAEHEPRSVAAADRRDQVRAPRLELPDLDLDTADAEEARGDLGGRELAAGRIARITADQLEGPARRRRGRSRCSRRAGLVARPEVAGIPRHAVVPRLRVG
jgi:hypothetical protein